MALPPRHPAAQNDPEPSAPGLVPTGAALATRPAAPPGSAPAFGSGHDLSTLHIFPQATAATAGAAPGVLRRAAAAAASPTPVAETGPFSFDLQVPSEPGRRHDNLTQEQATRVLQRFLGRLLSHVSLGLEMHQDLRKLKEEQWIVGFFAQTLGNSSLPEVGIWSVPRKLLWSAQEYLDAGQVEAAREQLQRAAQAYHEAQTALDNYREGTIKGAERSETGLQGVAIAGAVAATVATGGAAAGGALGAGIAGTIAGGGAAGLATTAGIAGATAGVYGATQTGAGQTGEMIAGTRATGDFDGGAILRRGAADAVTGFVGALVGGALSRYLTRFFGSYLAGVSDDLLLELGKANGLTGPLPRDFFLTTGQRFVTDFLGNAGAAPLTVAVTAVVNRMTGSAQGGFDGEQFARDVFEEIVRGGAIQVFLSAILHRQVAAKVDERLAAERTAAEKAAEPAANTPDGKPGERTQEGAAITEDTTEGVAIADDVTAEGAAVINDVTTERTGDPRTTEGAAVWDEPTIPAGRAVRDGSSPSDDTTVVDGRRAEASTADPKTVRDADSSALESQEPVVRVPAVLRPTLETLRRSPSLVDRNTAEAIDTGRVQVFTIEECPVHPQQAKILAEMRRDPKEWQVLAHPITGRRLVVRRSFRGFANATGDIFIRANLPLEDARRTIKHEVNHNLRLDHVSAKERGSFSRYEDEFQAFWVGNYDDVADPVARAKKVRDHILGKYSDLRNSYDGDPEFRQQVDEYVRPTENTLNSIRINSLEKAITDMDETRILASIEAMHPEERALVYGNKRLMTMLQDILPVQSFVTAHSLLMLGGA